MTFHEIVAFMSPALSNRLVQDVFASDKESYKAALSAVANARRVRPLFLERQPRADRHPAMIQTLSRPSMEEAAAGLVRAWLLKQHQPMLVDFLDALEIAHKDGIADDLPASVDDTKLRAAVERLLSKHPPEVVAVYLYAFNNMNDTRWQNLDAMLEQDARLQLGG
jgi:hypothetical protein